MSERSQEVKNPYCLDFMSIDWPDDLSFITGTFPERTISAYELMENIEDDETFSAFLTAFERRQLQLYASRICLFTAS